MRELANLKFKRNIIKEAKKLPENLDSIVMEGFDMCGEVVFAKGLANPSKNSISDLLGITSDLTGVECNINKIHIEDFVPKNTFYNHNQVVSDGFLFMKHMASAICSKFPQESFRFILSEEEGEFPSVVFRFHRKRSGESWLSDDIERYEGGVCFLDTE